jgi:hypothetical protein
MRFHHCRQIVSYAAVAIAFCYNLLLGFIRYHITHSSTTCFTDSINTRQERILTYYSQPPFIIELSFCETKQKKERKQTAAKQRRLENERKRVSCAANAIALLRP